MTKLSTEKQGRLFAIAVLRAMEREVRMGLDEGGYSPFSAQAEGSPYRGEVMILRTKPQSRTLQDAMARLHGEGTPAAIAGAFVVLSDFIGMVMEGSCPTASACARMEKRGRYDPAGSMKFRYPRRARASFKRGFYRIGRKRK